MTITSPQTLLELLEQAPRSQTAIVLPDENVKVSYDSLRQQIHGVADAFASAGIKGGDLGNVAFNPISALTAAHSRNWSGIRTCRRSCAKSW